MLGEDPVSGTTINSVSPHTAATIIEILAMAQGNILVWRSPGNRNAAQINDTYTRRDRLVNHRPMPQSYTLTNAHNKLFVKGLPVFYIVRCKCTISIYNPAVYGTYSIQKPP
ncbi:uncharacterized protein METZ01_LOCUS152525 [marine metagenome]|uniref:Uncharacterized protein n=1 Tax=marine metagenome TaxID=408172 RepID=A0A382AEF6_9ZZZZ